MITKVKISGLTCPACKKVTEGRIGKIQDVMEVKVDLGSGEAEIDANRAISKNEITEALQGTHYQVI